MSEYNVTEKAKELFNKGYDTANKEWQEKINNKIEELDKEKNSGDLAQYIAISEKIFVLKDLLKEN